MTLDSLRALVNRPEVRIVRDLARAQNVPVLLVGGAVRDALLGHPSPHDLDFAVQGDAVRLGRAVANALGASFYVLDAERGTARVLTRTDSPKAQVSRVVLDFAVCRGPNWRTDAFARDFTVNAIGVNLGDGALVDEANGLADLDTRVIRATNEHAMGDDPVRALRAVRLSFALDMRIEPATLVQVRAAGAMLNEPSAERLRDELMAILSLRDAGRALQMLDDLGLLVPIVSEIEPMRACDQTTPHRFTVLQHTWEVLATLDGLLRDWGLEVGSVRFALPDPQRLADHFAAPTVEHRTRAAVFRFAALLHDCGKPATRSMGEDGRVHFYGHETAGAALAVARARALRLSGDEVARVFTIVRHHMRANFMARQAHAPTLRVLYRFFRDAGDCAPELALFAIADCVGKRGAQTAAEDCAPSVEIARRLLDEYYARFERSVAPPPLLTGRDVIALGVKPGPRVGEILEAVREAQMIGEIGVRDEALVLARQLAHSDVRR
ncbi:MAG: HDIG domain-containing protein [Candidatus Roseilinea sp.]|nr:MAG: HDIG domain-containing protein [Candidatus Roseilinea sp.]